jgi:hypothetical protein
MEIPKSLQTVWNDVSKDNKITKQEYQNLVDAASPNKSDDEFDKEEIAFLSKLKGDLGNKNSISISDEFKSQTKVSNTSGESSQKDFSFEVVGNVGNASNSWAKKYPNKPFPRNQMFYVTKDGNLVSQAKINESAKKDPNYFSNLGLKGASAVFIPNMNSKDSENFKLQNNKIVSKNPSEPAKTTENVSFVDESEGHNNYLSAQNLINEHSKSFQALNRNPELENKANNQMKYQVSSLSNSGLLDLKEQMKSVSYGKSNVGVYHSLNNIISEEINKRGLDKTNTEVKTQPTDLPPLPDSLKPQWDELSKDGEITPDDYSKLIVAATPNNNKSEVSPDEFKFLMAIKNKIKEGNGTYKLDNKSEIKPEQQVSTKFSPKVIPDSIKETWNKVSADGKITKADYNEIIKAAAPNGKDEELEPSEVEFLKSLKEKFTDSVEVVDVEVIKPQENKPEVKTETSGVKIPSTLESIWKQISQDKEITVDDLDALIKAAKPNGKDDELDADEIKFISDLTKKMIDGNGVARL